VSPTTKFLVFAIFVAVVLTLVLNLMDIPFGWGYSRAVFVIMVAILLYALLSKIADKLRRRQMFSRSERTDTNTKNKGG